MHAEIQDLGLRDYTEVWELQKAYLERRIADEIPDQLLLVEHPPVFTTGRRFKPEHLQPQTQVPVVAVERGGDITFHEPGQLVGYPIIKLVPENRDIHRFLRQLETVLIAALADFGIVARADPTTGVWVGAKKIASIGVAFRRWVSYHGFALNINNALEHVKLIQPCGFAPATMTTMARVLEQPVDLTGVKTRVSQHFLHMLKDNDVSRPG